MSSPFLSIYYALCPSGPAKWSLNFYIEHAWTGPTHFPWAFVVQEPARRLTRRVSLVRNLFQSSAYFHCLPWKAFERTLLVSEWQFMIAAVWGREPGAERAIDWWPFLSFHTYQSSSFLLDNQAKVATAYPTRKSPNPSFLCLTCDALCPYIVNGHAIFSSKIL